MLRTFALVTAFALAAGPVSAQTIDKNGKCHDAKGAFAKMEVCKAAAPVAAKCRDKTTRKFAKCSAPTSEPMAIKN